ncbi:MAG: choice-of-anchor B family protein [Rhodothermales bacterium]
MFLIVGVLPAAGQHFGGALAIADGEIFVGEPDNLYRSGVVYHFVRRDGAWALDSELVAPNAEMADNFGSEIAIDGDRMIVGSRGPTNEVGSAYVYGRQNGRWVHEATLSTSEVDATDGFGAHVALMGDVAFVGAPAGEDAAGRVFIFQRGAAGSWTQAGVLTGSDAEANADFGGALAVEDETLFIGAPGRKSATGGVYVFTYDESANAWTERAILASRVLGEGVRLGSTLAVDGDRLVAGAPDFSRGVGAALLFVSDPGSGNWMGYALLFPFSGGVPHGFSSSVAVDEDELWVGAPMAEGTGTTYRYINDDGRFSSVVTLESEGAEFRDSFGAAIALEGDLAAVGLSGDDYGAGSVAIYERDAAGEWRKTASLQGVPAGLEPVTGGKVDCKDGSAGLFDCKQVDLLAFLPIRSIGGGRGVQLNDIWGWTDPATNREYALVGRVDGTSFVDVTDPSNPVYLGDLQKTTGSPGSAWRDIKVYKNHAFIVSDNAGTHGMQVFDLTQLRDAAANAPVAFKETAHYDRINSAHNIVINTDTGFAYAVGSSGGGETCGGGLHMINIQDPTNPTFAGCYSAEGTGRAGTGYSHDAQCIVYQGPDEAYKGREICFGSNETALNVSDVSDKANPVNISTASYPNVSYTHQGWITDDHRYFFVDDELDELSGNVPHTRTIIWDVTDLDDPQLVKEYMWGVTSTDHNLYIRGNLMYQSNYYSGLRIHDISDPENPVEVGFFDTMPVGEDRAGFAGSWSNYPYFESGTIAVSSIGEGLFLVKKKDEPGL